MCVCVHVFAAEPAVFGVCADCGRLSPPRQIPVFVCFLPSLRAPLSTGAASWSVWRGSVAAVTPSVANSGQHVSFIWEITVQLSPLVSNLLAALNDQEESVVFPGKQG